MGSTSGPGSPASKAGLKYKTLLDGIVDIYQRKIEPVEKTYLYEHFYGSLLREPELRAKPMILLLGQYSTGKTSLIERLLGGRSYPGAHVGPEPTTDRFVAVMDGPDAHVLPGPAATVAPDLPFRGLADRFGTSFLTKFQVSTVPDCPLLQQFTLIDTPGVLSGEKQRHINPLTGGSEGQGRSYDFVRVTEWFAQRSDLIICLFDAHKLDISDEFKRVMGVIRPYGEKVRVLLNKSETLSMQALLRVYGALMWSLGKVLPTPEVVRVYIVSFGGEDDSLKSVLEEVTQREATFDDTPALVYPPAPNSPQMMELARPIGLIRAEMKDLMRELLGLPAAGAIRRLNDLIARCKRTLVHVHLLLELRQSMPTFWGKQSRQQKLLTNLPAVFTKVAQETHLSPGDFPALEAFRDKAESIDFGRLPKERTSLLDKLQEALNKDFPALLSAFPQGPALLPVPVLNPFKSASSSPTAAGSPGFQSDSTELPPYQMGSNPFGDKLYEGMAESDIPWMWSAAEEAHYERVFYALASTSSSPKASLGSSTLTRSSMGLLPVVSGAAAKGVFLESKLPESELRYIWNLADGASRDGVLDRLEWCVAMRLIHVRQNGGPLPSEPKLPPPLQALFQPKSL